MGHQLQAIMHVVCAGASCSVSGKRYERLINDICTKFRSPYTGKPLSTTSTDSLGGCSERHDLQLNWRGACDVNVEIKRKTAPDWIQARLLPDPKTNMWCMKGTGSSVVARDIIEAILKNVRVYDVPPPFILNGSMTHHEWMFVKDMYPDVYISCPNDTIAKAYLAKGVHYIQIEDYGLYHTGKDVCEFGVPIFDCMQRLRVRCKRHGLRCKVTGHHIPTSVTAALRPVFKTLERSPISIDKNFDCAIVDRPVDCVDGVLTRAAWRRVLDGGKPYGVAT